METTMQYKTIVLELLQQRTELHEQLRKERKLLTTMEFYANELKESHGFWIEVLERARPGTDASLISSEAMERALHDLEDRLPSDLPTAGAEVFSLDAAMAFIRKASPKK
jgi:hypothetical protein